MTDIIDKLEGWITVKEAAKLAGMEPQGIHYHIVRHKFVTKRAGSIFLIEKASFDKFNEGRKKHEPSSPDTSC